jgi:hypothetical protein
LTAGWRHRSAARSHEDRSGFTERGQRRPGTLRFPPGSPGGGSTRGPPGRAGNQRRRAVCGDPRAHSLTASWEVPAGCPAPSGAQPAPAVRSPAPRPGPARAGRAPAQPGLTQLGVAPVRLHMVTRGRRRFAESSAVLALRPACSNHSGRWSAARSGAGVQAAWRLRQRRWRSDGPEGLSSRATRRRAVRFRGSLARR